MAAHMLSTVDNPYNPFDHWDEWLLYDTQHNHNTCGLLARVAINSDELSETDQEVANEFAIDEVLREDARGIYIRVTPETVIRPTLLEIS